MRRRDPISILGNTENLSSTSRPRLIENEDRPCGAVLLARTRLLERLRGVPLSGNSCLCNYRYRLLQPAHVEVGDLRQTALN
nr:hypothetical protein CFP56_76908 [Quercus suber]